MRFLERHTIVHGWAPIDINGAVKTSDCICLKNWNHVAVVFDFGVIHDSADMDITIFGADDVAMTHSTVVATYNYRLSPGSTSDDLFAAWAQLTDSKIDVVAAGDVLPATNNQILVIEFDAAELKALSSTYVYDCIYAYTTDPGQSTIVGLTFILSEPRFAGATMPSAIVD